MTNRLRLLTALVALAGLVMLVLAFLLPPRGRRAPDGLAEATATRLLAPALRLAMTIPQTKVAFVAGPQAATAAAALPTTTQVPGPAPTPEGEPAQDPATREDAAELSGSPLSPDRPAAPARIRIAALGIDAPVVEVGWAVAWRESGAVGAWETVRDAAGHHRGSADAGQDGNCVLSGHSSDAGGAVFQRLDEIALGQQVELEARNGQRSIYVVEEVARLDETAASEAQRKEHARWLEPTDEPVLTLVTCWPAWAYTHRLVVRARLDAPSPARPSALAGAPALAPCAAGLVITGVVEPAFVGPGDQITLTVQIDNVGQQAFEDLRVGCVFPMQVEPVDSDCLECDWSPETRRLTALIGEFPPESQMVLQVMGEISRDVWPGRALALLWQGHEGDVELCSVLVPVELPWAELPQTGERQRGVTDGR